MQKAFVISTIAAGLLGYAAGFASDNLTAKAAVPIEQIANVHVELTAAQINALETFANNTLCPTIDSNLGLSGADACDAGAHAKRMCFDWKRTAADPDAEPPIPASKVVAVGAAFGIHGNWSPGAAQ